jgi:hypothetical protein
MFLPGYEVSVRYEQHVLLITPNKLAIESICSPFPSNFKSRLMLIGGLETWPFVRLI